MAKIGQIPEEAAKHISATANFDVARIDEIESVTRHDMISFLSCVC